MVWRLVLCWHLWSINWTGLTLRTQSLLEIKFASGNDWTMTFIVRRLFLLKLQNWTWEQKLMKMLSFAVNLECLKTCCKKKWSWLPFWTGILDFSQGRYNLLIQPKRSQLFICGHKTSHFGTFSWKLQNDGKTNGALVHGKEKFNL